MVLADRKPALIQAQNVVPLYRRNELSQQQVLAVNEVAGVLDTAALKQMRRQVADGADPRTGRRGVARREPARSLVRTTMRARYEPVEEPDNPV